MPLGSITAPEPLPDIARSLSPIEAIEDAVRPALMRPPCVVSFSGGRDSSAMLAVATALARREGHPLPVPATIRFRDASGSEEADWQELVVRHLGLQDWVKVELTEELDLLGPISTAVLRRHGLLFPANAYLHVVVMRLAAGGSVVTGFDGDGVFGRWRYTLLSQLCRAEVRPRRAHVRLGAAAVTPPSVRGRMLRAPLLAATAHVTWLSPPARRRFLELYTADKATEPPTWAKRVAWVARRRYLRLAVSAFDTLGDDEDTVVFHPILDPRFLSALARWGGRTGHGDRTSVMTGLFGHLLPAVLVRRSSKATFDQAIWRSETRLFLRQWDGAGIDTSFVDTEELRRIWAGSVPTFASALLAQQAWLATSGHGEAPAVSSPLR